MAVCTRYRRLPPDTAGTSQKLKRTLGYDCRTPRIHAGDHGSEEAVYFHSVLSLARSACGWPHVHG